MARVITKKNIYLKQRSPESHKGENGKVLAVGGSIEYTGAIMLAGMAAYRTGVDLVVIAAPERTALAASMWPDFITKSFKGGYFTALQADKIIKMSKDYDVVLIGNGMGRNKETKEFAKKVIKKSECRKVIDADAIKAIRLQDAKNSIITPHRKEFEILLQNSEIKETSPEKQIGKVQEIIEDNVILLKGRTDIIISSGRIAYNKTGNAGMTVGGTGDVLAGVCAGLLAQKNGIFESASAAAYINGLAGDMAYREYGYGLTATDVVDKIAEIMRKLLEREKL